MNAFFGTLPDGQTATLYTLSAGALTAKVTDLGATLVSLMVPDKAGNFADVVLGHDDVNIYATGGGFAGATVGRNANRVKGAGFMMKGKQVRMHDNENGNNLHSGPDTWRARIWKAENQTENAITFYLRSPDGDQGFPGNADVRVTYTLEENALRISYDAVCDQDTVFNLTNHSYFNLAGQEHQELAMNQTLMMPARFFNPDDAQNIPTGELRSVEGTPMDFRTPKALGRDIREDYEPLKLQFGYDHNFEVWCNPCAVLHDPISGRTMEVHTDCPGVQVYTANFLADPGKNGVVYQIRCGVALETQFYPDSVNHPEWPQPFVKAGEKYHSETCFKFV